MNSLGIPAEKSTKRLLLLHVVRVQNHCQLLKSAYHIQGLAVLPTGHPQKPFVLCQLQKMEHVVLGNSLALPHSSLHCDHLRKLLLLVLQGTSDLEPIAEYFETEFDFALLLELS